MTLSLPLKLLFLPSSPSPPHTLLSVKWILLTFTKERKQQKDDLFFLCKTQWGDLREFASIRSVMYDGSGESRTLLEFLYVFRSEGKKKSVLWSLYLYVCMNMYVCICMYTRSYERRVRKKNSFISFLAFQERTRRKRRRENAVELDRRESWEMLRLNDLRDGRSSATKKREGRKTVSNIFLTSSGWRSARETIAFFLKSYPQEKRRENQNNWLELKMTSRSGGYYFMVSSRWVRWRSISFFVYYKFFCCACAVWLWLFVVLPHDDDDCRINKTIVEGVLSGGERKKGEKGYSSFHWMKRETRLMKVEEKSS